MEIRWLGEVELTVKYVALSPPAEEEEPLSDPFAGTGGSRLPALGWEPLWVGVFSPWVFLVGRDRDGVLGLDRGIADCILYVL